MKFIALIVSACLTIGLLAGYPQVIKITAISLFCLAVLWRAGGEIFYKMSVLMEEIDGTTRSS